MQVMIIGNSFSYITDNSCKTKVYNMNKKRLTKYELNHLISSTHAVGLHLCQSKHCWTSLLSNSVWLRRTYLTTPFNDKLERVKKGKKKKKKGLGIFSHACLSLSNCQSDASLFSSCLEVLRCNFLLYVRCWVIQ